MLITHFGTISSQCRLMLQGWSEGKKITIPSTLENLYNFPVSVYLNSSNFDFSKCKPDGADIRFTDDKLNPLKFERKEHIYKSQGVNLLTTSLSAFEQGTAVCDYIWTPTKAYDGVTGTGGNANTAFAVSVTNNVHIGRGFTVTFTSPKMVNFINIYGMFTRITQLKVEYYNGGSWVQYGLYSTTVDLTQIVLNNTTVSSDKWRVTTSAENSAVSNEYWHEVIMSESVALNSAVYNIQVPKVSTTSDTNIYMWYGNPNAYNASIEAWQDMTGKQLTYNGNVKLSYYSAISRRCAYFDGSGDYFTLGGQSDFAFGTGDFCIELRFTPNSLSSTQVLYDSRPASTDGAYVTLFMNPSNQIVFLQSSSDRIISSTTLAIGEYYDIKLCRKSGITRLYIDNTQEGLSYTDVNNYLNGASRPMIGAKGYDASYGVNGYIYGMRITKGRSRDGNIVPDTYSIDGSDVVFCTNFDTIYDQNYVMVQHMGASLVDATGNGNNGTANGTTIIDTAYGKARSFNGSSDSITIVDSTTLDTQNFTSIISAKPLQTTGFADGRKYLISKRNGASDEDWLMAIFDNNVLGCETGYTDGTFGLAYSANNEMIANTDMVLAMNHNNGLVRTFKDGGAISATTVNGKTLKTNSQIRIGWSYAQEGTGRVFYGVIGETRISNTARSDAWIKAESLSLKNQLITINNV